MVETVKFRTKMAVPRRRSEQEMYLLQIQSRTKKSGLDKKERQTTLR